MILKEFDTHFLEKKTPVLVAVSGGPDSLTLLHGLLKKDYRVIAAHFNHRLRPGSDRESQFVENVAGAWGIPFVLGEKDVGKFAAKRGLSIEKAARDLRYSFFFSTAEKKGAQAVAVGHTADDQVETVLMHIIRGAGVQGLRGMSVYSLPHAWSETIPLVRPLLSTWSEEIDTYCQKHNLEPVLDPSNRDVAFFRNRVRHQLLPLLEKYNPGVRENIWQMAEILRGEYLLLEQETQELYQDVLIEAGEGYRAFSLMKMKGLEKAQQRRLIRKALSEIGSDKEQFNFSHIERARRFVYHPSRSGEDNLVGGLKVKIQEEKVIFYSREVDLPLAAYPQMPGKEPIAIPGPGRFDLGQGWTLYLEILEKSRGAWERILNNEDPYRAWFAMENFRFPLSLSKRARGERFTPLGMGDQTIKVSDLMINEKIPADARDKWPILRAQGRIVWVPGCRIAHFARVTEETQTLLHASLRKEAPAGV